MNDEYEYTQLADDEVAEHIEEQRQEMEKEKLREHARIMRMRNFRFTGGM